LLSNASNLRRCFAALILSGGARVEVLVPATGEKRTAGVFGAGSLIGEMALWAGLPDWLHGPYWLSSIGASYHTPY
jgi:hypothetical protein